MSSWKSGELSWRLFAGLALGRSSTPVKRMMLKPVFPCKRPNYGCNAYILAGKCYDWMTNSWTMLLCQIMNIYGSRKERFFISTLWEMLFRPMTISRCFWNALDGQESDPGLMSGLDLNQNCATKGAILIWVTQAYLGSNNHMICTLSKINLSVTFEVDVLAEAFLLTVTVKSVSLNGRRGNCFQDRGNRNVPE